MDVSEQIKRFEQFVDQNYSAELLDAISVGNNFLVIDFARLSKFDPELADLLLDQPEEVLKAFEIAIKNMDVPDSVTRFYVRFKNLPRSQAIKIRDIRSKHINKLIFAEGIVRQKSDVRPQVTTAKFECPSCGNVMSVIQLEAKFKEPSRCGCGRKGKFRLLSKELVDAQKIVLEEISEELEGGEQPKRMDVFLKNDLVSPLSDKNTNPGTKIRIVGQVKEIPIPAKDGGKLVRFDLMIDSNMVESIEESFGELKISKEEEKQIKELSKDPKILNKLVSSIAPSIYGHDKIKEAIILQLLGGVKKVRTDGVVTRGDMHILLVGDPGAGKSQLLKRAQIVAPKSRYVSGKGASGAGLTAAVVRDEFLRGWALEAGALVLANKGFCLTGETEILVNDSFKQIKDLYRSFKRSEHNRITGLDYESLKFDKTKIKNFSRRKSETFNILLENGDNLSVTAEHPILIWDNGYFWKKTGDVEVGDYIITKRCFPSHLSYPYLASLIDSRCFARLDVRTVFPSLNVSRIVNKLKIPRHRLDPKNKLLISDIKRICKEECVPFENIIDRIKINHLPLKASPELGELLGLVMTDGHISRKKYVIRFFNKSAALIGRFIHLSKELFGIAPSVYIDKRTGVQQCFFCSREVHMLLQDLGIKKGNKSNSPLNLTNIRKMPEEFLHAFFCGVINGNGCVCDRKTGGIVEVIGGNRSTLEQIRRAIRPLGILGRVRSYVSYGGGAVSKRKGRIYKLSITGIDNLRRIKPQYLVKEKADKLRRIIRSKGDSSKVPKVYDLFNHLNTKLPHSEKKILYENSVRLSRLRKMGLSRQVFEKVTRELAEANPAKYTEEVGIFRKIIEQDMIFLKVIDKRKGGKKEVYNLQVATVSHPNFFANFIPVHNCMIDEMDKMTKEDRDAMHEALEQQTVSISKANIQATLRCETTVLAAANPKWGRFDPYEILGKQIDLPPALISRFDLIFPIRDLPNKDADEKLAGFVLNLHQTSNAGKCDLDTDILKKYIAYARTNCVPKLTDGALEEIKDYYVKMRGSGGEEGSIKAIPITARQLEALVRLSEASARTRLSDKVIRKDARKAIELLHYCMSQVGIDPDTGKIDVDVLTTGVSSSARSNIIIIKEAINDLENKIGKTIPVEDIVKEVQEKGVSADKAEEVIEKLKRSGDIFEPKRGFIQKI